MKVLILTLTLLSTLNVQAQEAKRVKLPASYIVSGKNVSAAEALAAALKNEPVLKCNQVELKPSKSGTSFSLRNK